MLDRQAFAVEAILKKLPKDDAYAYRKSLLEPAMLEVPPGDRTDVSWITTENPDRMHEVVRARGMNDGQFRLNPLVTLNHAYWAPPAGKSLWRKVVRAGDIKGVKARTYYPHRPNGWTEKEWIPDVAFALVEADLLRGKSIGFLPTKVHVPDQKEIDLNGWGKTSLVIDEWVLLEYACVYLPAQQNAVVEAVGKSFPHASDALLHALGIVPQSPRIAIRGLAAEIPFRTLDDIEEMLLHQIDALDLPGRFETMLRQRLDQQRGRV
jgi:hypothetical protein